MQQSIAQKRRKAAKKKQKTIDQFIRTTAFGTLWGVALGLIFCVPASLVYSIFSAPMGTGDFYWLSFKAWAIGGGIIGAIIGLFFGEVFRQTK